ncbi:MAG: ABC transporter ATP-binding protein [Alphaproteobacteria bacterium]|nr:ABC transporter ATP-binding protein [Alphaproteobacteria bacterium]MDE2042939.1 ABC transporter ATP-binding protein [Alphaproteobacteria bacterium]
MIALDRISVTLGGRRVLTDVYTSFAPGRITAILGPNGAGKTTLLKAMLGLVKCEGDIALDRASLPSLPPRIRAQRLGYLAQNATPAWNLRCEELVMLGRAPHRSAHAAPSPADHESVRAALAACDACAFADRPINTLSGGEVARVLLARVLATRPAWLLIDEPLNHLDPKHQAQLLSMLRAQADAGRGVIIVLHDLNAAAQIADNVLLLKDGRVLAQGAVADVLTPQNLATAYDLSFREIVTEDGTSWFAPLATHGLAGSGSPR